MTKEQQVDWLCRLRSKMPIYMPKEIVNNEMYEALDTVIKALEQEYVGSTQKHVGNTLEMRCDDAISRQAAKEAIRKAFPDLADRVEINSVLNDLPSVTPKQRTGHWIFDEILDKHYYCSECKSMGVDYWDYCPNCGAKMVEPQESEG